MEIKKSIVSVEKEYDTLRQEIIKRMEFQQNILNIKLTTDAVFLGLGVNRSNNLLIMLIPVLSLLFVIIWRQNTYHRAKVSHYLKKKFEHEGSELGWETYNIDLDLLKSRRWTRAFLSLGLLGIFLVSPLIAIIIASLNYNFTLIETVFICIDLICIFSIVVIFIFFNVLSVKKRWNLTEDIIIKNPISTTIGQECNAVDEGI